MNHAAPSRIVRTGRRPSSRGASTQRGVALVVALILLVVITLVGLAAVRGTIMQQKMTANFYDREVAFQATEAALRQAEALVQGTAVVPSATSPVTLGFDCRAPNGGVGHTCRPDPFNDTGVPAAQIQPVATSSFNAGGVSAGQPQYVIEYMGNFTIPSPTVKQLSNCSGYAPCGNNNTADFYRVTARSGDPAVVQNRSVVELQTMYRR